MSNFPEDFSRPENPLFSLKTVIKDRAMALPRVLLTENKPKLEELGVFHWYPGVPADFDEPRKNCKQIRPAQAVLGV